jgi:hypothetical protein
VHEYAQPTGIGHTTWRACGGPGTFDRRAAIIDAVAGHLAEQTQDELNLTLRPHAPDLDQARE